MITVSTTLANRYVRELARSIGSEGMIAFYAGAMPGLEEPAGERVATRPVRWADHEPLAQGIEPDRPKATEEKPAPDYWRLLDNTGLVLMQGDWSEHG